MGRNGHNGTTVDDFANKDLEYLPYTLPIKKVVVYIAKLPPYLMRDISRAFPPPAPPKVRVEYEAGEEWEVNEADPDYAKAKTAYQSDMNEKFMELAFRRAVKINLTAEQRAEVEQLKTDMLEVYGLQLAGSDEYLYLTRIATADPQDLGNLLRAVTRRMEPTEEAVEEAAASF